MPIPSPNKGEKESDFIGRCAGDALMVKDYTDQKQRVAICYQQWRDAHKPPAAAKSALADLREVLHAAIDGLERKR